MVQNYKIIQCAEIPLLLTRPTDLSVIITLQDVVDKQSLFEVDGSNRSGCYASHRHSLIGDLSPYPTRIC